MKQSALGEAMHVSTLKRIALSKGCTVECDSAGRWCVYQVCAPPGKIFKSGAKHLRVEWPWGQGGADANCGWG